MWHSLTLGVKRTLACVIRLQRYPEAEQFQRKMIETSKRTHVAEHEETLTCQYGLSIALYFGKRIR